MSTVNYKSESARAGAVFRYFLVSWFATLFTFGLFLAVAAWAGVLNVVLVLIIIAAQNVMWMLSGILMTAVFDSLTPPTLPTHVAEKHPNDRIIPVYKGKKLLD
jgi:ABC-type Fe3+-siderophore transport system permease subunit